MGTPTGNLRTGTMFTTRRFDAGSCACWVKLFHPTRSTTIELWSLQDWNISDRWQPKSSKIRAWRQSTDLLRCASYDKSLAQQHYF